MNILKKNFLKCNWSNILMRKAYLAFSRIMKIITEAKTYQKEYIEPTNRQHDTEVCY